MKEILELIESGITDKKIYKPLVAGFSGAVEGFLNKVGYEQSKNRTRSPFRISSEERLKRLKKQLDEADTDPRLLVPFGVRNCSDKFDRFLDAYNFGHVSEFNLTRNGWIEISVRCSIHQHSRDDKKISGKEMFEAQIKRLEVLGLSLAQKRAGIAIPFSEENILILKKLLREIGGRRFRVETSEDWEEHTWVEKVSFMVRPEQLLEYTIENDIVDKEENHAAFLTADEMAYVKKLINEICSAAGTMNEIPSLIQTCGNLIESQIFSLCKIFNVETDISRRYFKDIETEREINQEIRLAEESLKQMAQKEEIGSQFKNMVENIDCWARSEISFSVNKAQIDRYGYLSVQFNYLADGLVYEDSLDRKELTKKYKCSLFPNSDDEFYIIGCDSNKNHIEKAVIEKFPGSEILEWNYIERGGMMVIKDFKVLFQGMPVI